MPLSCLPLSAHIRVPWHRFEDPFPEPGDPNVKRARIGIGFAIAPYQPYEFVGDAAYSIGLASDGKVHVNRSGTAEVYPLCAVSTVVAMPQPVHVVVTRCRPLPAWRVRRDTEHTTSWAAGMALQVCACVSWRASASSSLPPRGLLPGTSAGQAPESLNSSSPSTVEGSRPSLSEPASSRLTRCSDTTRS